MRTTFRQDSAKIYEFPRKGVTATGERRRGLIGTAFQTQQFPVVEAGSGWYHEAAIQEADRDRKP